MASILPAAVRRTIDAFASLPGIGPKTAQRLAFILLRDSQEDLDRFAGAVANLKKDTVFCGTCHAIAEATPCETCSDKNRDASLLCVVEESLDVVAMESTGRYKGLYHVLGGAISPIDNVGPGDLTLTHLERRIKESEGSIEETILAMNPSTEGEATSLYITKMLEPFDVRVSRLARGLPTGGDLEYADHLTLVQAFEGRRELSAVSAEEPQRVR